MPSPEPSALATLGWIARYKALARKNGPDAANEFLVVNRVPEQVRKAAIGGAVSDPVSGGYPLTIGTWSDAARTKSAFYRMMADNAFIRVPWHVRIGLATSSPTAGMVAEGRAVPVSKEVIGNVLLTPVKVGGLAVFSDILLLTVDGPGQQMFNRELLGVVASAVDTAFVAELSSGLTPITSTGTMADLRAAMLAVASDDLERPYWIGSTDVGKLAATLSAAKGGSATAAASPTGGELSNVPFLTSSGVPSGTLYYVNAAQIVANGEPPTIDASMEADIEMSTTPAGASDTPAAVSMVNMFGTNSVALRATAYVAFKKLRSSAVSVVTGITSTTWASV